MKNIIFLTFVICLSINKAALTQEYVQFQNARERMFSKSVIEAEPTRNTDDDTIMVEGRVYYKKGLGIKNPYTAFVIGLVPGFLVHGLGHLYAGDKKAFKILLIAEGIWFAVTLALGVAAADNYVHGKKDSMISEESGNLLLVLFIGPWIYDFIASPILVNNENKRILEKYTFSPSIKVIDGDKQIGLKLSYHF